MGRNFRGTITQFPLWKRTALFLFFVGTFYFIRLSKGAGLSDAYAFLTRPFRPGPAQREWIQKGIYFEHLARIKLLEKDNKRLRGMLSLQHSSKSLIIFFK